MRNQIRGNLVLGALKKKETFETAKEIFLLPFLEFQEVVFFPIFEISSNLHKNLFGNHYNFLITFE